MRCECCTGGGPWCREYREVKEQQTIVKMLSAQMHNAAGSIVRSMEYKGIYAETMLSMCS